MLPAAMAQGQGDFSLDKGDRTFTIGGSGSSDKKFDANAASVELGLSWFIADNIAVVGRQGVSFADVSGNSDWNGSTRVGMDFYFDLNRVKPYLGAGLGYVYGDTIKNQFIAGPNTGLLVFVNDTTFVNVGVEYQFLFRNTDEISDVYDDGRFVYSVGMGVKW